MTEFMKPGDADGIDIESSITENNSSNIMSLGDNENAADSNRDYDPLIAHISERFERSKLKRKNDETRWLEAYRNYRGIYSDQTRFTDTEKSRVFVKVTKTKVLAGYAQITDVLFSGVKFPVGIEPSPNVTGVLEAVYFDPKEAKENKPQEGENPKTKSARSNIVTRQEILDSVGPYKDSLQRLEDLKKDTVKEGYGQTPSSFTFEPAVQAAKNMERLIHDQLEESHASKCLRNFVFEMCLFGTGVFKGPMALRKEYPRWSEDGTYSPEFKDIADVTDVSVWHAYPDPDSRNAEEMEYLVQRYKFSKSDLRKLKSRPYFRSASIDEAIKRGFDYTPEYWESELEDYSTTSTIERYEVLEYWGVIDKEVAKENNLKIPKELRDQDQIQVNVWICQDQILRLVLNPFNPVRIPYYICPYELNPYSIFGIGIAENMADTQTLMNGFMRLGVDNAALSSNLIFEVDENNLVPGQDLKIYPGKVFRRQGGAPGQAVFSTKFQDVTPSAMAMFDKARQIADEATGMPSYAHGQGGIQQIGRTASGMSMLMGAAAQNIKAVVKNIDDYLLAPLGKSMFAFNMQFNFDKKLVGDLEVVPRGTESLMRNEVRSQKILQFLQISSNPMDGPFVKRDYLLRQLSESLDLDSDKTVNDPREAAIQAEIIGKMKGAQGEMPQAGPPSQPGNPSGAPSPSDPTQQGGGNIGPGAAPEPGAEGFSSNGGTGGTPPPQGE